MNWNISGNSAWSMGLVSAKLVRVWSVIIAALSKSGCTVREAIWDMPDGLPVNVPSGAAGSSAAGSYDQV